MAASASPFLSSPGGGNCFGASLRLLRDVSAFLEMFSRLSWSSRFPASPRTRPCMFPGAVRVFLHNSLHCITINLCLFNEGFFSPSDASQPISRSSFIPFLAFSQAAPPPFPPSLPVRSPPSFSFLPFALSLPPSSPFRPPLPLAPSPWLAEGKYSIVCGVPLFSQDHPQVAFLMKYRISINNSQTRYIYVLIDHQRLPV